MSCYNIVFTIELARATHTGSFNADRSVIKNGCALL